MNLQDRIKNKLQAYKARLEILKGHVPDQIPLENLQYVMELERNPKSKLYQRLRHIPDLAQIRLPENTPGFEYRCKSHGLNYISPYMKMQFKLADMDFHDGKIEAEEMNEFLLDLRKTSQKYNISELENITNLKSMNDHLSKSNNTIIYHQGTKIENITNLLKAFQEE